MTDLKSQAARQALAYIKSGMVLGLGSGSTSHIFVNLLGQAYQSGSLRDIWGVPTSQSTAKLAEKWGIPLVSLADKPFLDLAIDGADEVDPQLNLIKGLGKALLREKMVEVHARQFLVIVDESKLVKRLGTRGPLPIEMIQFEWRSSVSWLNSLGCRAELWRLENGEPAMTDNGNYLALCWFEHGSSKDKLTGIADVYALARQLADRPGIVEHGLFLDMATRVIVAGHRGISTLERNP